MCIRDRLKDGVLDNIPTVSLDENDMGDGGNQNISSLLTAGRDPFYSAASFNFSAVRFRIRGYDNDPVSYTHLDVYKRQAFIPALVFYQVFLVKNMRLVIEETALFLFQPGL